MGDTLLTAQKGEARLYAVACPETRETAPLVSQSRLTAYLRPFTSEADARAALVAAGGILEGVGE